MKRIHFATSLLLSSISILSFAQEKTSSLPQTGKVDLYGQTMRSEPSSSDPKWSWEGQMPVDAVVAPGAQTSNLVRMQDFEIKLTREISDNVRASVKFKLDRVLRQNGNFLPQTFNFEDFIKEAKIEIRNVGGMPIAIVIGKQEMAFGVDTTRMPIPPESPVHNLVVQNEVIGFTVALEQNFNIFDKVEISSFETKAGDLNIGSFDGASVRLSKNVTEQLRVVMSAMHLGNGYDPTLGSENRQSVGLVFKTKDGKYEIYTEAVHFDNNQLYKNSHFAIAAGVIKSMGPGFVTVEATMIPRSLRQVGIGYNFELRKNLYVGPEIRYTQYTNQYSTNSGAKSGVQVGVRVKYLFDGKGSGLFRN